MGTTSKRPKKAPSDFINPHAQSNIEEIPRILKIQGQVEGVKKMIESKRHCYEVIHQIRAVQAALRSLESNILENHIEHILSEIIESKSKNLKSEKTKDLLNILKGKCIISTSGS